MRAAVCARIALHASAGFASRPGSSACAISSPEPRASSASASSRPCSPGAARPCTSCCAPKARASSTALLDYWGARSPGASARVPVYGDLTAKKLGVSADDLKKLKGQVDHVYHLAAVYDLSADAESQIAVNIEGTRARRRVRQGGRCRPPAPRQLDRRRRPLRRRLPRGHVRRGRGPRPSVLHDQAREREDRAQGVEGAVDGVPARRSSSATRRPARWTRSTARTTSSS